MYEEFAKRGAVFLAVNLGDSAEGIRAYFNEQKFTFKPVRQKRSEISKAFGVRAYPTNYIVAPDGTIAEGALDLNDEDIREALERLLAK